MNTSIFCFRSLSAQARPKTRKLIPISNQMNVPSRAQCSCRIVVINKWFLDPFNKFFLLFSLSLSLVFLLLLYSWNTLIAEQRFSDDVSFRFDEPSAAANLQLLRSMVFDGRTSLWNFPWQAYTCHSFHPRIRSFSRSISRLFTTSRPVDCVTRNISLIDKSARFFIQILP